MNLIKSVLILLVAGRMWAEPMVEDPFAPHKSPTEVIEAAWERLIVRPHVYDKQVIALDGWVSISKEGDDLCLKVYKSFEDYTNGRLQSYVSIQANSALWTAYEKGDHGSWQKLSGRYAIIWGKFEPYAAHKVGRVEGLGELNGPFWLYFPPTAESNLEPITIESKNARWNENSTR